MKVAAIFNEQGLQLVLTAESEPEKKMIGAVLNQPFADPGFGSTDLHTSLLTAAVSFEGHWSNKTVDKLTLRVHRQENG